MELHRHKVVLGVVRVVVLWEAGIGRRKNLCGVTRPVRRPGCILRFGRNACISGRRSEAPLCGIRVRKIARTAFCGCGGSNALGSMPRRGVAYSTRSSFCAVFGPRVSFTGMFRARAPLGVRCRSTWRVVWKWMKGLF